MATRELCVTRYTGYNIVGKQENIEFVVVFNSALQEDRQAYIVEH